MSQFFLFASVGQYVDDETPLRVKKQTTLTNNETPVFRGGQGPIWAVEPYDDDHLLPPLK
jgi:hypothetical protein